jgi:hypothetical protein
MFSELAAKGADALGKAYVLTGLLPACLLLSGLWCLYDGADSIIAETNALLAKDDAGGLTWRAIGILALSFVLMVLREAVISFFEDLPGRWLAPLRNRLIVWALLKRRRAVEDLALMEAEFSAVHWLHDNAAERYVATEVPDLSWERALGRSGRAFTRAYRLSDGNKRGPAAIYPKEARLIAQGLLALYAYEARHPGTYAAERELTRWRNWLANKGAASRQTLMQAWQAVQREIASVKQRASAYSDSQWIKPTRLGNLFSVLQDYAEQRYEIATSLLWEHIWWSLPDGARKEVGSTRTQIEALMMHSLVLGMLAAAAAVLALLRLDVTGIQAAPPAGQLAIAALIFAALAYGGYRLALVPARAFTRQVMSLIDLYRLPMLKDAGLTPKTVKEELAVFAELDDFWRDAALRAPSRALAAKDKDKDKSASGPES